MTRGLCRLPQGHQSHALALCVAMLASIAALHGKSFGLTTLLTHNAKVSRRDSAVGWSALLSDF